VRQLRENGPGRVRAGFVVAPALIVCLPLIAFSFQGDERRNIYFNAERFGTNPLEPARQAIDEIDVFLRLGNFRPIGRFFDYTEHSLVFEAAEATGLAPHVVHGVVRMAMVALLAFVAWRLVRSLTQAADAPVPWFVPAVIGVVLVAGGPESPLVHFPFLFLLSALIVVGLPQVMVQSRDFAARLTRPIELVLCALAGAAAAMFFDLVYVVVPLTILYLAALAIAAGVPLRVAARSPAARRVAALTAGFFAVFVPVRIMIANECGDGSCYSGSDLDPSTDALFATFDRMVSGLPPAGWRFNGDLIEASGAFFGFRDLAANSLLLILAVGLVGWTVGVIRIDRADSPIPARVGGALALVATGLIVLPALLVSLSTLVQRGEFAIGRAWRDSVLVELGWGVAFVAVIVVLMQMAAPVPSAATALRAVLTVMLVGGLVATLLANVRLQEVDRRDPVANLTNQISVASVDFDLTPEGDAHRCSLLDRYTEFAPNPEAWIGGPMLRANLDRLAVARHGRPFCESS
jgi:hypothetical protein